MKKLFCILIFIFVLLGCSTTPKNESPIDLNIDFQKLFLFNIKNLDSELNDNNDIYHEQKLNKEDINNTIYKYDLELKNVVSEEGVELILNDYEYLTEINNCKTIKYILRKITGDKYTFYLFNENGDQIKFITVDVICELPWLKISDDEKFFFIDSGTSCIRSIYLFEYTESKFIGCFTCVFGAIFLNNYLYMTQDSIERIPGYCINEMDHYYSVVRYNLNSNVTEVLLP